LSFSDNVKVTLLITNLSKLKNLISLVLDKIITQFFLFCDPYVCVYQIGYELSWSMELEILVWTAYVMEEPLPNPFVAVFSGQVVCRPGKLFIGEHCFVSIETTVILAAIPLASPSVDPLMIIVPVL
jgi:hypothetical protein